eukprot:6555342-Pyramimonas_sp.AAC.1
MKSLRARLPCLQMLRRGAGVQVTALWRTGLLPAAGHAAAVAGATPSEWPVCEILLARFVDVAL